MEEFAAMILESTPGSRNDTATVAQILTGLSRKVDELLTGVDKTASSVDLARFAREHERILKYLNVAIVQSVNPWLERQTSELATEFEFREQSLDPGDHYYYVRVEQEDGNVAWASPIWVTKR